MKFRYIVALVVLFVLALSALISKGNGNLDKQVGECVILQGSSKNNCVLDLVKNFTEKGKISESLSFLRAYSLRDSEYYGTDCHGAAHFIGDAAYGLYKTGKYTDFGKDSNVCSYGFYHAFTSSFVVSGDFTKVGDFCLGLETKSDQSAVGCYHGIGHGAIYDFFETYKIRDPQTIINKSVALCQKIMLNENGTRECITGVYDGIGDEVLDPSYTNLTPTIIYSYCKNQPEKYKPSCYENISHLVFRKTRLGFENLVNYATTKIEPDYRESAVKGLATIYVVDLKGGNIEEGVGICLKLAPNILRACIKNMTYKIAADIEDGSQYEAVKNFCYKAVFAGSNRDVCINSAVEILSDYFDPEELKVRCSKDTGEVPNLCKFVE